MVLVFPHSQLAVLAGLEAHEGLPIPSAHLGKHQGDAAGHDVEAAEEAIDVAVRCLPGQAPRAHHGVLLDHVGATPVIQILNIPRFLIFLPVC